LNLNLGFLFQYKNRFSILPVLLVVFPFLIKF
jgi:hypothetical protein